MNDESEKKKNFLNQIKGSEWFKKSSESLWSLRIEVLSIVLLIIGLILSFFYIHIGGVLVGLGTGICFFEQMHQYLFQTSEIYSGYGVFRTLMLIGVILYFLISIPIFVLATACGFGAMYIIQRVIKS